MKRVVVVSTPVKGIMRRCMCNLQGALYILGALHFMMASHISEFMFTVIVTFLNLEIWPKRNHLYFAKPIRLASSFSGGKI